MSKERINLESIAARSELRVLLLVPFHGSLISVLNPNSIMYIKDTVNSPFLDQAAGFVHM